ncbi:hypothetical protein CDD80_3289 [Ophiocordyceps camponoti-rufipedis]|uniref:SGNH hydrolase-type esterase domain-containing protein n=1 Tax=Ophiocordyceps camponoti-rufipedis TaxID=2004952 RepID=A0A2C5Z454_9HYPO|nr:hypothetical protein CDD80_3289 [Ophiocordyceps camponoti-rufipedis]
MAAPYPQLVLFGDSLLEEGVKMKDGFSLQAALQTHCLRRLDVVNRGLSGYNTVHGLRFIEDIFPPRGEGTPEMKYLVGVAVRDQRRGAPVGADSPTCADRRVRGQPTSHNRAPADQGARSQGAAGDAAADPRAEDEGFRSRDGTHVQDSRIRHDG